MPVATYQTLPKIVQFQIGESHVHDVQTTLIGIVKRDSQPVPRTVMGLVENSGETAFTVEIDESANNNTANLPGLPASADAYADRAIRVDGAAVATGVIAVQPGGRVVFVIETLVTSDRYWRFQLAAATPTGLGRLTLTHYDGTLEIRQRESVP